MFNDMWLFGLHYVANIEFAFVFKMGTKSIPFSLEYEDKFAFHYKNCLCYKAIWII